MPVIQQAQPVLIQGAPTQATMPRVVPVQIQHANVTTLPVPVKKVANHIPLARCRVLYLGSAVPLETSQGIDAVQGPCRERYPFQGEGEVKGIDAWLSVFSSGILLSYVDDKSGNTWFPIQSLYVCTAVKCVIQVDGLTGEKNAKFVALDSEEAKGSMHPPMFAAIMRRTKGKKVLECHVFMSKSPKASMALVQSCTHAYEHKEGWTEEPPSTVTKPNAPTRLVPAKPQEEEEKERQAPPEFFEAPPAQGYFYASNKDLVKSYNVFGGSDKNQTAESEPGGVRRQPAPPQATHPGAPGAPGGPVPQGMPYYPTGPASTLGPPGAPVPPPFGPAPPPGVGMMPPPGLVMPPPGMGMPPPGVPIPGMYPFPPYPMPPPPPGYFSDWDRFEGRPVAVFDERNQSFRPPPTREPEPPRRERDHYREPPPREREYREAPPPHREYREALPRERDYREAPPPRGQREYREYREPPPKEYREGPSRSSRRPRSKSPRKYSRMNSPSPPRQGYRQDAGDVYRSAQRARSPPVDYERRKRYGDAYTSKNNSRHNNDYHDDDLFLYAPKYRQHLPEYEGRDYGRDGREQSGLRRKEGRDYVEYTSNFSPEIKMKGSKDYRENRGASRQAPPQDRTGYVRDDEDPYRYERDLPRPDHYPRQERGFERSLQEERETIGDTFSDAYRENEFETGSAHIEYGMFHDMREALGYIP